MTMTRERNTARGTFRLGSRTSSLHWAMISYPSKAMKVRPMAMTTLPKPLGMKSVNVACQSGRRRVMITPKTMNTARMTILPIVTTLPALPVSEAPR